MATLEKGIAFSREGDYVRGTFDGKYTVIPHDHSATDEDITDQLRREFKRGNWLPIPADAATNRFPEPVETRVA